MDDTILTPKELREIEANDDILDKLGPLRDVEDEDDLYVCTQRDVLQLSLLLRDKSYVTKSVPFAEDVVLYCVAHEYMTSRTFPDNKMIDDLFPGVRERFDALDLTPWQCYEVIQTYVCMKNDEHATLQKADK